MISLENYLQDGAGYQARAILMLVQGNANIEESWNDKYSRYDADVKVARLENYSKQGYIISLCSDKLPNSKQLNIVFFDNEKGCHATAWEEKSENPLTSFRSGVRGPYRALSVCEGETDRMAEWIILQLKEYWKYAEKD